MSAPRFLFVSAPAAAAPVVAAVRRGGPIVSELAPTAAAVRAALGPGAAWTAVVVVPGGPVDEVEAALYVPDGVPLVVVDGGEALLVSDDEARSFPLAALPTLGPRPADGPAPAGADDGGPLAWGPPAEPAPPALGDGHAAPAAPPPAPADDDARPPVLVVEDNGDTRMLLERILRKAYRVTAVGDARSALQAMNGCRFAGLVLDINLGGKETGADVLRIARSLVGYEGVFAVALTAYALPGDRERLLESGFDEYVSKPFTRQALMDVLAAGVGARVNAG
jgi:CheY-like chemotaxis protein